MKLWIVGIGPGGPEDMTFRARRVLETCQTVVGYTLYIEQIKELLTDKEILTTPMKREAERCRMALESAASGKETAMICGGDPGVYGMAGLLYELAPEYPGVELEVIPGVTAATAAAALLGAPLGHDFAVISLSDLLTDWETIEKRLEYAALGDFAVCLYNPGSRQRKEHLRKACEILLRHKMGTVPCGCAREIGRLEEAAYLCNLEELMEREADMSETVIIGNSATRVIGGKLVTPRGYSLEASKQQLSAAN